MSIVIKRATLPLWIFIDEADGDAAQMVRVRCRQILNRTLVSLHLKDPCIRYSKLVLNQNVVYEKALQIVSSDDPLALQGLMTIAAHEKLNMSPVLCCQFFKLISFYWHQVSLGHDLTFHPLKDAQAVEDPRHLAKVIKVHTFCLLLLNQVMQFPFVFSPLCFYFFDNLKTLRVNYLEMLVHNLPKVKDRHTLLVFALLETVIKDKKPDYIINPACHTYHQLIRELQNGKIPEQEYVFSVVEKLFLTSFISSDVISTLPLLLSPKDVDEAMLYLQCGPAMRFMGSCYLIKNPFPGELFLHPVFFDGWTDVWIKQLFCLAALNNEVEFLTSYLILIGQLGRQTHELTFFLNLLFPHKQIQDEALIVYFDRRYVTTLPLDRLKAVIKMVLVHQRQSLYSHIKNYVLLSKPFIMALFLEACRDGEKAFIQALLKEHHADIDETIFLEQLEGIAREEHHDQIVQIIKSYYPYFIKSPHDLQCLNKFGLFRYQKCIKPEYLFTYLSLLLTNDMVGVYDVVFHAHMRDIEDSDLRYLATTMIQKGFMDKFYAFYESIESWHVDELTHFVQEIIHVSSRMDDRFLRHVCIGRLENEEFAAFLEKLFSSVGIQGQFYAYLFLKIPYPKEKIIYAFEFLKEQKKIKCLLPFKFCSFITQDMWDLLMLDLLEEANIEAIKFFVNPNTPKLSDQKYEQAQRIAEDNEEVAKLVDYIVIGSIYKKTRCCFRIFDLSCKVRSKLSFI